MAILEVAHNDDLMIINRSGIAIRTPVDDVRVIGRNTQGVKLIRLNDNDSISSVTKISREEEEEPIVDLTGDAPIAEGPVGASDGLVTESEVGE